MFTVVMVTLIALMSVPLQQTGDFQFLVPFFIATIVAFAYLQELNSRVGCRSREEVDSSIGNPLGLGHI
jgi:uncharacterized membrane protein YjjP (DUF1212 family)